MFNLNYDNRSSFNYYMESVESDSSDQKASPSSGEVDTFANDTVTDEIKLVDLAELRQFFIENRDQSYDIKLSKLKEFFTFVPADNFPQYWNLWLEIPQSNGNVYIDLLIKEDEFDSQCYLYRSFNMHTFLLGREQDNSEKFYFQLRIDPDASEILHIQKGDSISGTDIKKICLEFLDFLHTDITYLHDDAKIGDMAMRVYLPIVNENPDTWYSKDGFRILNYNQLKNPLGEDKAPQNENHYYQSVYAIRNCLIKNLLPIGKAGIHFPKTSTIKNWIALYAKGKTISNCTIHELASGMYLASRNKVQTAESDFFEFYSAFLSKTHEFFPVDYQNSLIVMHQYQLWYKM